MLGVLATASLITGSALQAHSANGFPGGHGDGSSCVTPEQFGAVGDGVADDAPAIQRALDMLAASDGGILRLQPRVSYRCNTGLVLDASRVLLTGHALLDFTGWAGRYLHITASSTAVPGREAANNYGHKGGITGAVRLRGAGQNTASIGIDFDTSNVATAAQLLVENLSISACGTGIRFGSRAYNNLLVRCELFSCDICIDWPAADDNGERNTLAGCVIYNSRLAVRMALGSACLQLIGCSIDYTSVLYEVAAGSVLCTSCHHESSVWDDRPIRCAGDGSLVRLDGGWILNQATGWNAHHLADVGKGAVVHLSGMFTHNLSLAAIDLGQLASFATGDGEFLMTDTRSFEFSPMPPRLLATRTRLSDPDFRSDTWEDLLWRLRDTTPIVDRYGSGANTLRLTKGEIAGERGLVAVKAGGGGTSAALVLLSLPVRYGEAVLSGFRVRRDPRRPGHDGTLFVSPTWLRIDGQDSARVPIIVRLASVGTATISVPTDRFLAVAPLASRSQRTAPLWATHFSMVVDFVRADEASFIFNGLWADTI